MLNYRTYTYIPAGSLASRMTIEQSSYTTTPSLSPGERTPPSGQATYKRHALSEDNIDAIHKALLLNQETFDESSTDQEPNHDAGLRRPSRNEDIPNLDGGKPLQTHGASIKNESADGVTKDSNTELAPTDRTGEKRERKTIIRTKCDDQSSTEKMIIIKVTESPASRREMEY